jgi:hypothetical protein
MFEVRCRPRTIGAKMGAEKEAIIRACRRQMVLDPDVSQYTDKVIDGYSRLLDACEIRENDGRDDGGYTADLVLEWIVFAVCGKIGIGGSLADYCAGNCQRGTAEYRLELDDEKREDIAGELVEHINGPSTINPGRELAILRSHGIIR